MTANKNPKQSQGSSEDLTGKDTISQENHGNVGQRQPSADERPDLAGDKKRAPERGDR